MITFTEGIEHVRRRPGMYVGSKDLFGLINYLVCPFNLLLSYGASWIDISVNEGTFEIISDAHVKLEETPNGIVPFEVFHSVFGHGFEGPILAALSSSLMVSIVIDHQCSILQYRRGQRVAIVIQESQDEQAITKLTFVPDGEIFENTNLSEYVFHSYFHRISHLHPGVRFRFISQNSTTEYFSANGIRDLFHSFSASFQILHKPIHIQATSDTLRLELIFAFHSWKENWILPFINHGLAVEGGSHETALNKALNKVKVNLKLPAKSNGVIAVMSVIYPEVVWEGCIKAKIRDKTLYKVVKRLVFDGTMEWVGKHPDVVEHLTQLRIFQFPELWYR